MFRRSLQLSIMGLCLTTLSLTSVNAQEKFYPPEVVNAYIENCTAGRGRAVRDICACTIRKIQTRYSFEEFKKINANTTAGKPLPPKMLEIAKQCQANPKS